MIQIIQPQTEKDLEGVANVNFRVDAETMARFWTDRFTADHRVNGLQSARESAHAFREHILAAKDGDDVVGMIVFSESYANFEGEPVIPDSGAVNNVYVLPEYRGRGIGRQLLDAALKRLGQYAAAVLYVYEENEAAKAFYRHYGFRFDGVSFPDGTVYRGRFERMVIDPHISKLREIIALFADGQPADIRIINTSHGESDFREAVIVRWDHEITAPAPDSRMVLKLADNGFTDPERIAMWERLTEEYRKQGCYCPRFLRTKAGEFPWIEYKGHRCVVYGEEFARFRSADSFDAAAVCPCGKFTYLDDLLRLNARIAAARLDFTDLPSAWCLFEVFDPADAADEVTENAQEWLACAEKLPEQFQEQAGRIWTRWLANREYLKERYSALPTSIFQADLNSTNVLLDEEGRFAGLMDFNLAGRETYLNYLFREVPFVFGKEDSASAPAPDKLSSLTREILQCILHAITVVRKDYPFCEAEKDLALPLFRCLFPLWFTSVEQLKEAHGEAEIRAALDDAELAQTMDIDFRAYMEGRMSEP